MDKKRQMAFNLNNFLLAFSDILNTKKATFIALNLGLKFGFETQKLADLCSYSLASPIEKKSLEEFDFLDKNNLNDKLFLQICEISKELNQNFDLSKNSLEQKQKCKNFVEKQNINQDIKNAFYEVSNKLSFWLDLENDSEIIMFIYSNLSDFTKVADFEDILKMTTIIHKFQNPQSNILEKASKIADFFEFEHKDKQVFLIATTLQNVGKLNLSKEILEKLEPLNDEEKELIKSYPYHTKRALNSIIGFADICSLAFKVQERLDGSGSFGLEAKDLSFKDRLLICLVIYSALIETKTYREAFSHQKAIEIMQNMAKENKIDGSIVDIFAELGFS